MVTHDHEQRMICTLQKTQQTLYFIEQDRFGDLHHACQIYHISLEISDFFVGIAAPPNARPKHLIVTRCWLPYSPNATFPQEIRTYCGIINYHGPLNKAFLGPYFQYFFLFLAGFLLIFPEGAHVGFQHDSETKREAQT